MICDFCGLKPATQRHHKFSQTKMNRATYGLLMDRPFNIMYGCVDCHVSHRAVPSKYIWDEKTFRESAVEHGYKVPRGTKSYRQKWES